MELSAVFPAESADYCPGLFRQARPDTVKSCTLYIKKLTSHIRKNQRIARYFCERINQSTGHHPSAYISPETSILKLNTNENPYLPSPHALKALKEIDGEWLRRYPDPYAHEFCRAAGKVLDVPTDWFIVGNGCDELLTMLMRACVGKLRPVVYPIPTYGLYRTLAELGGAPVVEIPYGDGDGLPLNEILQTQADLTLIASPNSPSGHAVSLDQLRQLAAGVKGVLAIDEAYVDFGEFSALDLVAEYEHVMILRTLSKGYGLAGLRFGFGVAQPGLLSGLFKVKDSYGVDAIAAKVAAAAITDQAYKNSRIAQIKTDRRQLTLALQGLGFDVPPSHGNFVFAQHHQAKQLHDQLKAHGILVRHFDQPGLRDKLRITVGTPEQNQQLLKYTAEVFRDL